MRWISTACALLALRMNGAPPSAVRAFSVAPSLLVIAACSGAEPITPIAVRVPALERLVEEAVHGAFDGAVDTVVVVEQPVPGATAHRRPGGANG